MDTILIIDDDEHLRKSFERLLTEEGYTVQKALLPEKQDSKWFMPRSRIW